MKEIKGFIFDLDGTIASTSRVIYEAYQRALIPWGKELNKQEIESIRGKKAECLFEDWGLNERENLQAVEKMNQYCLEHVERVEIFEGIPELLSQINHKKLPLSIWTGRAQNAAKDVLRSHGLIHYFNPIYGSNNVSVNKPNPEGIYKIAKDWNISPEELVMIGDHDHDIEAGKTAGCVTIRAEWRDINPSHEKHCEADYTFKHPSEFIEWLNGVAR